MADGGGMDFGYVSPFLQIRKLFLLGRRIVFIPNPGNLGDALICAATVQSFEQFGIAYSVFSSLSAHCADFVYVYGGGGNLVPYYDQCAGVLRDLSSLKAEVIVLPHSCHGDVAAEVISSFGGNLSVWARERASYGFLSSLPGSCNRGIWHDLALELRLSDRRLRFFQVFNNLSRLAGAGVRELFAFRGDCESVGGLCNDFGGNVDLPDVLGKISSVDMGVGLSSLDVNSLFCSVSWFLAYIDLFKVVRTDRLHVSIGALLLNKNVFLYDNSYGKCRAVYDYSLCERFGSLVVPMWRTL